MTPAHGRSPSARATGWTDPAFARVADVVHLVAGLVFPPNRQPTAESGMRRAMSSLHLGDPDALALSVQRPGEARDTVLAELTVGETYFFREAAQLDVLRTDVLPALAKRGPDAPVRIWSAGCASGEEPYSVAILLRELGCLQPARILGTDVARPRLDGARRGRYTRWSLRGVSEARIERWFERRASQFQLDPVIRGAVQFAMLNLIADDYPSVASGILDQDVVLCRNVLIYFDMASVVKIATRLLASLSPEGWLLLGASDPPLSGLLPCEVMIMPGGLVYRRADRPGANVARPTITRHGHESAAAPTSAWIDPAFPRPLVLGAREQSTIAPVDIQRPVPRTTAEHDAARVTATPLRSGEAADAYAEGDFLRAEALAREAVEREPSAPIPWVILIRSMANQGRLRESDEQCVRALDLHRLSPELHLLHATLLGAAGEYRESAKAARRALYLERRFTMAHLQLGDALAHLGKREEAGRAFENVLRDLASVRDEEIVRAADGIRASRLRQIAEVRLRGIHDGPHA